MDQTIISRSLCCPHSKHKKPDTYHLRLRFTLWDCGGNYIEMSQWTSTKIRARYSFQSKQCTIKGKSKKNIKICIKFDPQKKGSVFWKLSWVLFPQKRIQVSSSWESKSLRYHICLCTKKYTHLLEGIHIYIYIYIYRYMYPWGATAWYLIKIPIPPKSRNWSKDVLFF